MSKLNKTFRDEIINIVNDDLEKSSFINKEHSSDEDSNNSSDKDSNSLDLSIHSDSESDSLDYDNDSTDEMKSTYSANTTNTMISEKNNDKKTIYENSSDSDSDSDDSDDDVLLFQKKKHINNTDNTNRLFHKFTDIPYHFLVNNKLKKKMNLEDDTEYKIELFIHFICNNTENDPYLLFLLQYYNDKYNIPYINYKLTIQSNDENGFVDTIDLENKIKQYIFNIFDIEPESMLDGSSENINKSLFGYYKKDNKIIASIDGNAFINILNTNTSILSHHFYSKLENGLPKYSCTTIENVIKQKKQYNKPISLETIQLVENNKWMWEIKDSKGKDTELPIIGFSCNIKNNKPKIDKQNNAIIPYRHETELYYIYTFSNNILLKQEFFEKKEMQEYIIFNSKCIKGDINDIDKLWKDISYHSINFKIDNYEIIGIISHKFFHKI